MTRQQIPVASRFDGVRFTLGHVVPIYLQGLYTRSRCWVTFFSLLHPDFLSVRFVSRLRRKYKTGYLYLNIGRTKTLLVLDQDGIKRVLDHSPVIYAEPDPKSQGMSRFQPGAATISRGAAWSGRRRFNEEVLEFGELHRYAGGFLEIIQRECKALFDKTPDQQSWQEFEQLFERITLQIIFGRRAANDVYLTRTLAKLMRNANRSALLPPKPALFDSFYQAIHGYLAWPEPNSLAARSREVASTLETRVANQVVHWMFAMNETLATNTVRALALIATHREIESQLREELADVDTSQPRQVAELSLLQGCLQEAMRLWPTTPMLMRETTQEDVLGGETVPPRTRVLILNSFNHRDHSRNETVDRFKPQRWIETPVDHRFNHLSNGTQVCAGKQMALLLGTAVLASLLKDREYTLLKPQLDATKPLPHAMNYFRTTFACRAA
jgi:cytochrome P450